MLWIHPIGIHTNTLDSPFGLAMAAAVVRVKARVPARGTKAADDDTNKDSIMVAKEMVEVMLMWMVDSER